MERIYIRILGLFFLFVACSDYDDIAQWNMLQTHDVRISELESMCQRINTNIVSLKEVVNAVETNRTISQVLPLMDGSTQIGYTIMFSDGAIITLYNGRDGQDGKDGVDGEDGHTPSISVTRINGIYYWTLDGEVIKGEEGKYLRVSGENGKDGKDGVNGNDGLSPQFRIVEGEWGVSYDNGKTWATLGQATGNTGNTGANGITPKFQIVEGKWQVSYDDEKTWVTLGDAVGATGGNGKDGVTPQFRIVDGKWDISYDNGKTWATLGQATGNTGNIGANGITPKFQIVDGKWQVSYDDEKTWVTLGDAVGATGGNGKDGVTPQFRIVDGKWDISYDNGKTWATLGQATGNTGNIGANGITPKFQIVDGKWQVSYDDEKTWVTLGDAVGATGGNGKDGVTPQFRIVDGKWDISYDNGKTWATLGQATGNTGNIGANGITPKFQIVDGKWQVSYDDEKTWVTLGDAVGASGGNGKDGVTPQLKIGEDGYWYVSYDNKKTWTSLEVKATGKDGKDITLIDNGSSVTISDGNGNEFTLLKNSYTSNSDGTSIYGGYEAIDLGLPSGLKWASCNLGATKGTQKGTLFQWGETNVNNKAYIYNKTQSELEEEGIISEMVLCPDFDAASVILGNGWRMPTKIEFDELISCCAWITIGQNYSAQIGIGPNGRSIVFYLKDTYTYGTTYWANVGEYWSSTWKSTTEAERAIFGYRVTTGTFSYPALDNNGYEGTRSLVGYQTRQMMIRPVHD